MAYEQYKRYRDEIAKWLDFKNSITGVPDMDVITQKAAELPAIKHFWAGRLIDAKIELRRLEREREESLKTLRGAETEVALTAKARQSVIKEFYDTPAVRAKTDRMDELKVIIELLENNRFVLKDCTQDIANYQRGRTLELT